ncbi:MAG: glycosyltransferase [Epsilonproteobacteria bacterium]|nr:glycosyltransferase [Campylobacterota bacterium]
MKIKLVLAIRSLDMGGAERQFVLLANNLDKSIFDVTVVTMYGGQLDLQLQTKHINLHKKGRFDIRSYFAYKKLLHQLRADIIYSFLPEMNLFSLWAKPKYSKIVWGFRFGDMDLSKYGKFSMFVFFLQKKFAPFIDLAIANSYSNLNFHRKVGCIPPKAEVIYNGIDTSIFAPNVLQRANFREKYHLSDKDIAIGMVARLDEVKGYDIFLQAASKIAHQMDNVYFFIAGAGDVNKIKSYLNHKIRYLGYCNSQEVYNGLDVFVSASISEGFSNSIIEAMACNLKCIITDIGDNHLLANENTIIIPPNDADSMYHAMKRIIHMPSASIYKQIHKQFSANNMIQQTQKVLIDLMTE